MINNDYCLGIEGAGWRDNLREVRISALVMLLHDVLLVFVQIYICTDVPAALTVKY